MIDNFYIESLNQLKGKTIAIVYIFEKEDAPGFEHYHVWKSDVIAGWLTAVQELECIPFILDVRTFVHKAINRTLPHIDYVLNLNCGSCELSSMSLVPSMCSFLSIPCVPCDAVSIVAGENKKISNLIASAMNLNVPKNLDHSDEDGIFRPLNFGSSIGLKKGHIDNITSDGIYQEFIPGFDITIPIVYNPYIKDIDLLPPILYMPKSCDPNWIFGEKEKENVSEYSIAPVLKVDEETAKTIIQFAKVFPIQTFGRIDARVKSNEKYLSLDEAKNTLKIENLFFLEINPMPTVEKQLSFEIDYAFETAGQNEGHSFYKCVNMYKSSIKNPSINGFLLSCSMLALS